MAGGTREYVERARKLVDVLSEDALRAAVSYLEFLAYLEDEPPLTAEEREAVMRFHAGDVSHLVSEDDVWAGRVR